MAHASSPAPAADPAGAPTVLERGERLSRSILWRLQRTFFERQGIEAWRQGTVPHYVTSNPFIAECHARIVAGFLRDCAAGAPPIDPAQPIYLVELGSGCGRFAYHFLKALLRLQRRHGAPAVRFKYVMTDLTASTLAFWRGHPPLQPFVAEGVLDFARFDIEHDRELRLVNGGEVLGEGALHNPLVAIANYFFDGIPQDAFLLAEGQLHECLVTVTSSQVELDASDPAVLGRVSLDYEHRRITTPYYGDPELDDILRAYQQRLARTVLRFPVAALRCCQLLRRLSGGRLLLLSADKGVLRERSLINLDAPQLVLHGSFSLSVDYRAIAALFEGLGGEVLCPAHEPGSLVVAAFLLGRPPGGHPETANAFADAAGGFGPDDFFELKKAFDSQLEQLSLSQIVAFLRLARADSRVARAALPALTTRIGTASDAQKQDLRDLVESIWELYYHLGEDYDLAFQIAVLLNEMGFYREALRYYERSIAHYGLDAHAAYNMALCYRELREVDQALAAVHQALALQPGHDEARALRLELEAW
jgi:hypothetical protein